MAADLRGRSTGTMVATEDLFTPIHKAIRSMIYDVGGRLQSNDFADLTTSKPLLRDLEHEFTAALPSGCVLCLLHAHAGDEESTVFPAVSKHDAELVRQLIEDHHALTRRLGVITQMARALQTNANPEERVRSGSALNREANDFFAAYLAHMNREEEKVVPMMREHFTGEQMRAMRSTIMGGMPPDRLAEILRWMLPSLDLAELTMLIGGSKKALPPPMFQGISRLGEQYVPAARWRAVRERVGF
jgi:hypothetical protein